MLQEVHALKVQVAVAQARVLGKTPSPKDERTPSQALHLQSSL